MKGIEQYVKFQDRIFQEIDDRKWAANRIVVEQFVQVAATRGFTLDRLIEMAKPGISGAGLWNAVFSG